MSKDSPVGKLFVFSGFISLLGLVAGLFMLRDSWKDAVAGSAMPHELRLAELFTNGPGANRHVFVTECRARDDYVIVTTNTSAEAFYLVSPISEKGAVDSRLLLVHVTRSGIRERHRDYVNFQQFKGIYHDAIPWGTIGFEGKRLLKEKYPDINLDAIPYLEVRDYQGERFSTGAWITGVSGVVLILSVVGMVWFVKNAKADESEDEEAS
jgi:hypothetical protein